MGFNRLLQTCTSTIIKLCLTNRVQRPVHDLLVKWNEMQFLQEYISVDEGIIKWSIDTLCCLCERQTLEA